MYSESAWVQQTVGNTEVCWGAVEWARVGCIIGRTGGMGPSPLTEG